jgi:hypothetical protein
LERTLAELLERLPFFAGRPLEHWEAPSGSCAAVWVQHSAAQTGGVRYARAEPSRLALFSGRPFLWTDADSADGRAVLDPAFWFGVDDGVLASMDGRFAALRYDDDARDLEVFTDALGAYPIYEAERDGVRYVSNNPEAVRAAAAGSRELSLESVAGLLGGGWPLDGHPMWAGVRRLPPPDVDVPVGAGFDAARAAASLVASVRALADWPARPSIVPVTGGRDSRLVLGAAVAAGIDFETRTGGVPGHPDVEVGRALAEAAGVPWQLLEHDPHGSVADDWRRAAELLALTAAGTASLSDAAGFPFGPRPGPLWLWHSGQGGEVARSYYGSGAGLDREGLVDRLYRAFTGRRPGRAELLSAHGRDLVRAQIDRFVADQLADGFDPADVPDLFYLRRRMGTWAGPTHGAVEYVRDTTSPLWSRRLLRDELGLPAAGRERELFHLRVLERLAPQLVDVPFEDGQPWKARQSGLALKARRAAILASKAQAELRRRSRGARSAVRDPFDPTLQEIRDLVTSQPDHPAWQLLDRPRVEQLLATDAAALDTMSRYYAWRLATVFSAPLR